VVEVHDRTAIPDPPEFPVASSEGEVRHIIASYYNYRIMSK
jgi:hypothetical protein